MKEKIHFNSFEEMYAFSKGTKAREPKEYVEPEVAELAEEAVEEPAEEAVEEPKKKKKKKEEK